MRPRITCLVGLLAIAVLGIAAHASAAPTPDYFHNSNPGAICASLHISGQTVSVLVQINFDAVERGGIDLATGDHLFTQLTNAIPVLTSLLGSGVQVQVTCSFKPSDIQSMLPGIDAFQLVDSVSPSFNQLGFSLYIVLDAYYWLEEEFLGAPEALRVDAFIVQGANNLDYVGSASVPRSVLP